MQDAKQVILEEARKIAALLKIPVKLVLEDLAKGKQSKLIKYLEQPHGNP